jgi:lipopolysaccharide export LptBFGC system permease protein LptF
VALAHQHQCRHGVCRIAAQAPTAWHVDLFQYIRHLGQRQSAQRYEIEFWRKVFYPLSCLVMVVLALPFAYLHFRSGSIAGYVFGGVMAGISFFLLNNVFGYIGNLQNWSPWLTAAAPGSSIPCCRWRPLAGWCCGASQVQPQI